MPQVLLGFGGNLGDPVAAIETALARLNGLGIGLAARSGFYRTPPWGPVQQPDFVNLCALAATALEPRTLLATTQSLERELGRKPGRRWGPRLLDIDILDYEGRRVNEPDLVIPHPRLTERAFVLLPLLEIAPDWIVDGRLVREWAAAVDRTGVMRIEPEPSEREDRAFPSPLQRGIRGGGHDPGAR